MLLLSSVNFFQMKFKKKSKWNTIRVLNCLGPDQDQCSVSPNLGPNCLQRLSADDKKLLLARKEI